jgi:hypothetical protein
MVRRGIHKTLVMEVSAPASPLLDRNENIWGKVIPHDQLEAHSIRLCLRSQTRRRPELSAPAVLNAPVARPSLIASPDQNEHALK